MKKRFQGPEGTRLSPEAMRSALRNVAPLRNRDALRPAGIDLVVHSLQVVSLSRMPLRFRIVAPVSNFGRTTSGTNIRLSLLALERGVDAPSVPSAEGARTLVSQTLPALRSGEMVGVGVELAPTVPKSVVEGLYYRVWVLLETIDSRTGRPLTYSDADNRNNTAELLGADLIRRI